MKAFRVVLVLAILFSALAGIQFSSTSLNAFGLEGDSWIEKASMPYPITHIPGQAAVLDGKIYAIIRNVDPKFNLTSYTEVYDPIADTWVEKAPIPVYTSYYVVAACQNKIYVIGDAYGVPALNYAYDPMTDTWAAKTPWPTERDWIQPNVVDGKIYVIGGEIWIDEYMGYPADIVEVLQTNEVYDPATDSWSEMAPIPTGVSNYASAVLDGKIYIIGGHDDVWRGGSTSVNLVQIYDPKTNSWIQGEPLPVDYQDMGGASATTGVLAPKRIYVFGGHIPDVIGFANVTRIYDPESETWSMGTPMPNVHEAYSVVNANDALYVLFKTSNWQYIPVGYGSSDSSSTVWIVLFLALALAVVVLVVVAVRWKKRRKKET